MAKTLAQINAKLLPCPFCGGKAEVVTARACEDAVDTWARCTNCFVQTDHYEAPFGEPLWALHTWNGRFTPQVRAQKSFLSLSSFVWIDRLYELRRALTQEDRNVR